MNSTYSPELFGLLKLVLKIFQKINRKQNNNNTRQGREKRVKGKDQYMSRCTKLLHNSKSIRNKNKGNIDDKCTSIVRTLELL